MTGDPSAFPGRDPAGPPAPPVLTRSSSAMGEPLETDTPPARPFFSSGGRSKPLPGAAPAEAATSDAAATRRAGTDGEPLGVTVAAADRAAVAGAAAAAGTSGADPAEVAERLERIAARLRRQGVTALDPAATDDGLDAMLVELLRDRLSGAS